MAECTEQAQADSAVQRVMIPVDDSKNSDLAFQYYVDHMHRPENEVLIFHVSDQIKLPSYSLFTEGIGFSPEEVHVRVQELKKKNEALEDKYNKLCNQLKIKHKVLTVTEDPNGPGAAIVSEAKKHDVNLIVVGCRGLGALRRTILGSVSTYVIHHSHIPTLVCPLPKH